MTLGGLVTKVRPNKIKSGKNEGRMMGRFVLEDLSGTIPAILFADTFDRFGSMLEDEAVVIVKGFVRERGSDKELNVDEMVPLKKASRKLINLVELVVDGGVSTKELMQLRDLLVEHHGDVPLRLRVDLEDRAVSIQPGAQFKVRLEPGLVERVEEMLGEGALTQR